MKEQDKTYLENILEYISVIDSSVEEFSITIDTVKEKKNFLGMLSFFLLQIGENTGKLSEEFKEKHPEINWAAAKGLRNMIVHAYGKVDPDILWDTIENDLPELRQFCLKQVA